MSLPGVLGLEVQELGDDHVGDLVVDGGAEEHDAVLEQAGVDVGDPLAPGRALEDGGNKCNHRVARYAPARGCATIELRMEITREIELDAPADEVWRLLSDHDELAGWVGDEVRARRRRPPRRRPAHRWTWAPDGVESTVEVELVEARRPHGAQGRRARTARRAPAPARSATPGTTGSSASRCAASPTGSHSSPADRGRRRRGRLRRPRRPHPPRRAPRRRRGRSAHRHRARRRACRSRARRWPSTSTCSPTPGSCSASAPGATCASPSMPRPSATPWPGSPRSAPGGTAASPTSERRLRASTPAASD